MVPFFRNSVVVKTSTFFVLGVLAYAVTLCRGLADERALKANDEIQLTVFGQEALGATVRIDSSGTVNFPLVGNVEVAGKTASEVAESVEERLEKDYIRDAHVTVSVVEEFKEKEKPVVVRAPAAPVPEEVFQVTVLGEVKAPGTVDFTGGKINLLTALARSGGFSQLANPKRVTVKRVGDDGVIESFNVNAAELQTGTGRFELQPGDTVSVAKRLF